jgi:hypothetical protein
MLDAGRCCRSANVGFAQAARRCPTLGRSHESRDYDRAGQIGDQGLACGDVLVARPWLLHRSGLGGARTEACQEFGRAGPLNGELAGQRLIREPCRNAICLNIDGAKHGSGAGPRVRHQRSQLASRPRRTTGTVRQTSRKSSHRSQWSM